MRPRFNRAAVCSSENYSASRHSHLDWLKENHESFCALAVSSPKASTPEKDKAFAPKFKIIRVFGKPMKITMEEYNLHCKHLGL